MAVAALRGPLVSIQLAVTDIDATEAFYAGILGLPVRRELTAPGAPEHLILEQEGWNIIFVEEEAVVLNHPLLEGELAENSKGVGVYFHFRVHGLADIYPALLDEELEIVYPPYIHPYGVADMWCRDPDGYLVVLEEVRRQQK